MTATTDDTAALIAELRRWKVKSDPFKHFDLHVRAVDALAEQSRQREAAEDERDEAKRESAALWDKWNAAESALRTARAEAYDEGVYATEDSWYHQRALDDNPYRAAAATTEGIKP